MNVARSGFAAAALAVFTLLLFKHISYPLMWQDEAETALFAARILDHGYPKVHGTKNVLYEFGTNREIGQKETIDAYIGTTWGHFYFAVPGLLWSQRAPDDYAQTARLRIPFALAGLLGLLCFAAIGTPAVKASPGRARLFVGLFFLLCCFSISLILHLREVRYYALQILVGGAILAVYLRYQVYRSLDFRSYVAGVGLSMLLLFNIFYTAYFVFGILLGVHCLYVGWRTGADWPSRVRGAACGLAPLALSAIALTPFFVFYETFGIAGRFSEELHFSAHVYLRNIATVVKHVRMHELFLVATLARIAASVFTQAGEGAWLQLDSKRRVSAFLVGFAIGYILLASVNPLCYERYFLVLSPVFALSFLLDAFTLVDELPQRFASESRVRRLVIGGLLLSVVATSVTRIEDFKERVYEIRHRVEGPIDVLVEHLRKRYPRPEELIIATNYEAHPLMFYLGSRVIVGFSLNNIEAERELKPDVIVPRRNWRKTLPEIASLLRGGRFQGVQLDIKDMPYNNIPALSKTIWLMTVHQFRTARASNPERRLTVYHRLAAQGRIRELPSGQAGRNGKARRTQSSSPGR